MLLISLIGGRIIPSFTRNWLVRENPGRLPAPFGRFDMLVVAVGALALVCWIVSPAAMWTGYGARCMPACCTWFGWPLGRRPHRRERLVLILHLGYAFVPLGFLLNACSAFGIVPAGAGIHAWMARRRRHHDARGDEPRDPRPYRAALTASVATQAIYAAIIVAALARICAVLDPCA